MSMTRFLSALGVGLLAGSLQAQTGAPPELERWQDWLQATKPEQACPVQADDSNQRVCHFPAELTLALAKQGARFSQSGSRFNAGAVELIGDRDNWPQAVTVNGETAVVIEQHGKPVIQLPAGSYRIEGQLSWQQLPAQLPLPAASGLLHISRDGQRINPRIEQQQLLLNAEPTEVSAADQASFRVYRRLQDAVPQRLTTVLEIDAAGSQRSVTTGRLLLDNFAPISLESELPAKLNDDGTVSLQLRPGRFQLKLTARALQDQQQFAPAEATGKWPAQELWSVAEDLSLRQLQWGGAAQVDPMQTDLPYDWRELPAFIVSPQQPLSLQVLQQGRDRQSAQLNLALVRTLWLDFDGKGFTSSERIDGQFAEPARLLAATSYRLGSASVNGEPQVITHLPDAKDQLGVSVSAGQQAIKTSGRSDNWRQFSASGWQHGFAQARTELKLPPGWQLLHAQGADRVSNSWLTQWDLWAIFLVVIVTAASWQLFGVGGGLLAALAFVLSFHSQPLLAYWALLSLLLLAITRALPANRFRHWCGVGSALACLVFTLICLPFFVQELRAAFYPQLAERNDYYHHYSPEVAATEAAVAAEAADSAEEAMVMAAPQAAHKARPSKPRAKAQISPPRPALDSSLSRLGNAQTGPALPNWQWSRAELSWSGPITAEQQVRLWALPPWATMIWRIISVLLIGSFLGLLLARCSSIWRTASAETSTANNATNQTNNAVTLMLPLVLPLALTAALWQPTEVQANTFPSEALLTEYAERLAREEQARCASGQCASLEQVSVRLTDEQLTLELIAHAARAVSLPLPAQQQQWLPEAIYLNGEPSRAVRQDDQGQLWLALPAGRHTVRLQGASGAQVTLPFPLGAPNIQLDLPADWQVQGLRDGRLSGRELLLSQTQAADAQAAAEQQHQRFPSFVQVERQLELRNEWLLTTTVTRVAPESGAIRLSLPLLAGESVLSGEIEVRNQQAQVVLAADQQQLSWQSRLTPQAELTLTAADSREYAERWRLLSEPIWQVDYQGVNPLNQPGDALTWQPRAGETVTLNIASPIAAQGATYTIERANLRLRPGARAADSELNLYVRASAGGLLPLSLPAGSELLKLYIDGREQQLSVRDGKLNLPLSPGSRNYQLSLRHDQPQGIITRTPVIDTEAPLNNIELAIEPPANRWILAVSGPLLGPAVTYWGVLLVIVAAAILLGRWAWLPFGAATWLVLGIGMSTVNAVGSLWVVAWFIALRWRADLNTQTYSAAKLQWLQIGLALLTVIAGWQLLATIPVSLLSQPEMMIGGYESSNHSLNWYQDHAASMPVAEVLSLPLWVYRALMLAWSLWLALSLLKFARFGWQAFSARELWRAKPVSVKTQAKANHALQTAKPQAPEEPNA